jgi:hypothetical protein
MLQAVGAFVVVFGLLLAWTTIERWSRRATAWERGDGPCEFQGRCLFCSCGKIPLDQDE